MRDTRRRGSDYVLFAFARVQFSFGLNQLNCDCCLAKSRVLSDSILLLPIHARSTRWIMNVMINFKIRQADLAATELPGVLRSSIESCNMCDARRATRMTQLLVKRGARVAMLVYLLAAVSAFAHSAAAEVRKVPAKVAAAFDLDDIIDNVRFCYDRVPEIIYFRYHRESDLTSVDARSIEGVVRTVFKFPGMGDPSSLSCSVDGSTIAHSQ